MNDIDVINSVKSEINRDPFALTYTISGSHLRKLLRMSNHSHAQQIILHNYRTKNRLLTNRLSKMNDLKMENQLLKKEMERVSL